jgi:hypothetical protein
MSRLLRPRLALLNAVTAIGGYLLYPVEVEMQSLSALFCGVALLAIFSTQTCLYSIRIEIHLLRQ